MTTSYIRIYEHKRLKRALLSERISQSTDKRRQIGKIYFYISWENHRKPLKNFCTPAKLFKI